MKTSGLRIRIEPNLHKAFVAACQANDQSASQVLRTYMKDYVEKALQSNQPDLFYDEPIVIKTNAK